MPKRKLEDEEEWNQCKGDILNNYVTKDKSLTEVIHIMASRGFKRTKPQYERIFKQWNISKNVREAEWNFIFGRLDERQRMYKASAVQVRGVLISDTRLKKQKTKLRQTCFDQCLEQTGQSPRAKTPPGIRVFTPPASPTWEAEGECNTYTSSNYLTNRQKGTSVPHYSAEMLLSPQQAEVEEVDMLIMETPILTFSDDSYHIHPTKFSEERAPLCDTDYTPMAKDSAPTLSFPSLNEERMTVLDQAIVDGDKALFYQLLSKSTLTTGRLHPQYGVRGLLLAVKHHRVRCLIDLLCAGADPFRRPDMRYEAFIDFVSRHQLISGMGPFESAIETGNLDIIEPFLVSAKHILTQEELLGSRTQLYAAYASAICTGNLKLKAVLSKHGVDPEAIDSVMGPNYVQNRLHRALRDAVREDNTAKVKQLLEAGAPPDDPDWDVPKSQKWLPLKGAILQGNIWMVNMLIRAGASVNAPPHVLIGWTALQLAAWKGNMAMVVRLVHARADINARPAAYNGRTAIEAAAEQGHIQAAKYLFDNGADLQGRNNIHYRRSLYRAWKSGQHAMVDAIYAWMVGRYGQEDVEFPDYAIDHVTEAELLFIDDEARMKHEAYKLAVGYSSDTDEDDDNDDEEEDEDDE